jgi:hypothetical protein
MAEVAVAETEMAAALMAAYDALVEKVKARRPIGSDKKPTELGFVYSQLIQGLLVDPRDYTAPWSPSGGSSMQDAIQKGAAPAKAATPAPAAGAAPTDAAAPPWMAPPRRRVRTRNTSAPWMRPSRRRCWSTAC